MRDIRVNLTDNAYPLDQLFNKLVTYAAPSSALGQMDLSKARVTIDITKLRAMSRRTVSQATLLNGVYLHWNAESVTVLDDRYSVALSMKSRIKPLPPAR